MTSQWNADKLLLYPDKRKNASPCICCFADVAVVICVTQFQRIAFFVHVLFRKLTQFQLVFGVQVYSFQHPCHGNAYWPYNIPKISCFVVYCFHHIRSSLFGNISIVTHFNQKNKFSSELKLRVLPTYLNYTSIWCCFSVSLWTLCCLQWQVFSYLLTNIIKILHILKSEFHDVEFRRCNFFLSEL